MMAEPDMSANGNRTNYSLPVRVVWYVFVGWWASGVWLSVAWFLNLTIIGIPIGIKMINYTPLVLSLKTRETSSKISNKGEQSYGIPVRAVYFVLIGWWVSGIWTTIAYLLSLTVVGLPVAIIMYNKLPFVVSLYRY